MKNRTPVPRAERPPLPDFAPVPRKVQRHDGWTPERQKAFIEALADTGSVSRAAAMVNMTPESAYLLRRQPQADEFRRAWEAALDCGVARMKDIAFERAINGYLVPVITGGKLLGWRRMYNDRLLMFNLRHYGEDANGKRTTVNYFSTRAVAGASSAQSAATPSAPLPLAGEGGARAEGVGGRGDGAAAASYSEASTAVVRTTIAHNASPEDLAARLDATASALDGFEGIELDERARAEIAAVLEQCAARRRAVAGTADDEAEPFIAAIQPPRLSKKGDHYYLDDDKPIQRDPPLYAVTAFPEDMVEHDATFLVDPNEIQRMSPDELPWEMLGDEEGIARIEEAVESVKRESLPPPEAPDAPPPPRSSRAESRDRNGGPTSKRKRKDQQ